MTTGCCAPGSLTGLIGPSVLNGDLADLYRQSERLMAAGADYLHLDVMDGHFVPNLTFGHPVVRCLRRHLPAPLFDMHMMVAEPQRWVEPMAEAGASQYTFHVEALPAPAHTTHTPTVSPDTDHHHHQQRQQSEEEDGGQAREMEEEEWSALALCRRVREANMRVGVAVKPATPLSAIDTLIAHADTVLVMTVEPGFGGQAFRPDMLDKVRRLRADWPALTIQVDGGVSAANVAQCVAAGANWIVSGSAVTGAADPAAVIGSMQQCVRQQFPLSLADVSGQL